MSDKKDAVHKQAVLEFLYATAAQAVAHAAIALVEAHNDVDGADKILAEPFTRDLFEGAVESELSRVPGGPALRDATVGQVANAGKAVGRQVLESVAGTVDRASARPRSSAPIMVVEVSGLPTDNSPAPAPDASPGSSDFGSN
jgi:hypothetical protein